MIVIESTGRKLKDAIDNGLTQLNKSLEEVEVQILDNGGLFRKAKVRITVPGEEPPKAKENADAPKPQRMPAPEGIKIADRPAEERKIEKIERNKTRVQREKPANEVKKETKAETKERRYEPVTDEVKNKVDTFISALIDKMGLQAQISSEILDGELFVRLSAEGSALIGYHGEVVDSIEYMTNYIINRDSDKYYHISVDCNGYRDKRKESLVALANKMAAKCLKVRHKVSLEPMNSNERKIVHSALADNNQVITRSEGHEPNRHVVILCKKR